MSTILNRAIINGTTALEIANTVRRDSAPAQSALPTNEFSVTPQHLPKQAALEISLLLSGCTNITRIVLPTSSLSALDSPLLNAFACALSPVHIEGDTRQGYTENSHWALSNAISDTLACLWIGRSQEEVIRALTFDLLGLDGPCGSLLAYPECCVSAYVGGTKRLWTPEHPWALAPFWRFLGVPILGHFPCSPDCAQSSELASTRLRAMAGMDFKNHLAPDNCSLVIEKEATGLWLIALEDGEVLQCPVPIEHEILSRSWTKKFSLRAPRLLISLLKASSLSVQPRALGEQ